MKFIKKKKTQLSKKEKIYLALILTGAALMVTAALIVNKYNFGQNMPFAILIIGLIVFFIGAILLSGTVEMTGKGDNNSHS